MCQKHCLYDLDGSFVETPMTLPLTVAVPASVAATDEEEDMCKIEVYFMSGLEAGAYTVGRKDWEANLIHKRGRAYLVGSTRIRVVLEGFKPGGVRDCKTLKATCVLLDRPDFVG